MSAPKFAVGDWVKLNVERGVLWSIIRECDSGVEVERQGDMPDRMAHVVFVVRDVEYGEYSCGAGFGYSVRPHPLFASLFSSASFCDEADDVGILEETGEQIHYFYYEQELVPAEVTDEQG